MQLPKAKKDPLAQQVLRPVGLSRTSPKCSEKDGFSRQVQSVPRKIGFSRYFRMFRDGSKVVYATAKGKEGSIGTASTPTCRTFSDESKVLRERWFLGQVQSVPRKMVSRGTLGCSETSQRLCMQLPKAKKDPLAQQVLRPVGLSRTSPKCSEKDGFSRQLQSVPRKMVSRGTLGCSETGQMLCMQLPKAKKDPLAQQVLRPVGLSRTSPKCSEKDGFSDKFKVFRERWFLAVL